MEIKKLWKSFEYIYIYIYTYFELNADIYYYTRKFKEKSSMLKEKEIHKLEIEEIEDKIS